tara:strand:- start:304 stop:603 length:300 start_codon:yes stop_codon:yes gene_type:complete
MSLIDCVECGEKVDSSDWHCSQCGSIFYKDKGPKFLQNLPKESGWRYKGRNWGWLSLLQIIIMFFVFSSEVLKFFGVAMFGTLTYSAYLWLGAKNFWRP